MALHETDLPGMITPAAELYKLTEPDRMQLLRPTIADMMDKIRVAMANNQSNASFYYNRVYSAGSYSTKNSLNVSQIQFLTELFASKGYTISEGSDGGDIRDSSPSRNYLYIKWKI